MNSLIANLGIVGPLISFLFFPLIAQESIDQRKNEKCDGVQFIIEEQPDAPAQLTINETSCKSPQWREVELTLKNTGAKIINAYDVEYVDTYEYKTSISSQGVRGGEIESGKSIKVSVNGGFKDGLSYGKPVGALRRVAFRIKYIGFKDGLHWGKTEMSASQAPATNNQARAGKEYRFVASSNSNILEKELNAGAKEGFRLEFLSDTFMEAEVGALLSRTSTQSQGKATPDQARFEYKALGANKISTIRKELEDAASQGYELRGLTANSSLMPFTVSETIAVMERESGQTEQKYEYRFLTANREGTLQKELDASVSEGFHPVAMSVTRDNNAASVVFGLPVLRYDLIMRRNVENPATEMAAREYRFVSTMKVNTLEKEMNQLATKGYRCHLTAVGIIALMARGRNDQPVQRYEYRLLAARSGTLAKELAEAGRKGFAFNGSSGLIAVMEMERSGQATPERDYKLLGATRVKTTRKELDEALAAGYEPIRLASIGEFIIVLDRVQAKP